MKTSLTYEDAFAFVQARRFCVSPRIEFVRQLEAYRPILLANQAIGSDRNAVQGQQRARRRGWEEEDEEDEDGEGDSSMMRNEGGGGGPAMMRHNGGGGGGM